jgi:hypothetical protein
MKLHSNYKFMLGSFLLATSAIAVSQDSCEKLAGAKIPRATISMAQTVAAGAFVGPPAPFSGLDVSAFYKGLPAFCRVVAVAKPTADSEIKLEIWLPVAGWNGKLQGLGNGGFAGLIDYVQLGVAMSICLARKMDRAVGDGGLPDQPRSRACWRSSQSGTFRIWSMTNPIGIIRRSTSSPG